MDLNQVYNAGRSVYHSLCSLEDTFSTASRLAFNDLQDETVSDMTLRQRLPYWRRGYRARAEVLYDLDEYGLEDYLSDYHKHKHVPDITGSSGYVDNKLAFYHLLQGTHEDTVPDLYGLIDRDKVYSSNGNFVTNQPNSWLIDQVQTHERLICKPPEGWGGKDIHLLKSRSDIDGFSNKSSHASPYIVMEHVQQGDYVDSIYPHSANTVRAITMWDYEKNEPFLSQAVHRIGTDASAPTDNWSRGGISTNIDIDSGTFTAAATFSSEKKLKRISRHPDTDVPIIGTEIPDWDDLRTKLCDMAAQLRYLPLIGWDIIISEEGLKVIEGNAVPGIVTLQVHEPILADPRAQQFFEYHGVL